MLVKTNIENNILHITLNRANKKNAFNPEMIELITKAFKIPSSDKSVRGVFLKGDGDCFCAGADLDWMKSMVNYSMDENIQDSLKLHNMFLQAMNCEVPVIGFFQGYVMGGATGLVTACDVGVASIETKFSFSEVKIGLAPAVISPFILNKMNSNKANEFMLTGKMFSADEALKSGLVEYTGSKDECNTTIEKVLRRFRNSGPEATRATKKLIQQVKLKNIDECAQLTTKVISERRISDEGQEGLASFFEKRKSNWVGE